MSVQWPLPVVSDDDLGHDHGQGDVGSLVVQGLNVVRQRRDRSPVGRNDHFEWEVVTPGLPVVVKASGFVLVGADVHREHGLGERGRVGERVQAGGVDGGDGNYEEIADLGRVGCGLWSPVVPLYLGCGRAAARGRVQG